MTDARLSGLTLIESSFGAPWMLATASSNAWSAHRASRITNIDNSVDPPTFDIQATPIDASLVTRYGWRYFDLGLALGEIAPNTIIFQTKRSDDSRNILATTAIADWGLSVAPTEVMDLSVAPFSLPGDERLYWRWSPDQNYLLAASNSSPQRVYGIDVATWTPKLSIMGRSCFRTATTT